MFFGKPKKYKITFFSTGVMSNQYVAGVFWVSPSKKELRGFDDLVDFCFKRHFNDLRRHYKRLNDGRYLVKWRIETE